MKYVILILILVVLIMGWVGWTQYNNSLRHNVECETVDDCVMTSQSPDSCCGGCAHPTSNKALDAITKWKESKCGPNLYERITGNHKILECPIYSCMSPGELMCVNNKCITASVLI